MPSLGGTLNTEPTTVMAFDYGTRRVGVAVGNSLTRRGQALKALNKLSPPQATEYPFSPSGGEGGRRPDEGAVRRQGSGRKVERHPETRPLILIASRSVLLPLTGAKGLAQYY